MADPWKSTLLTAQLPRIDPDDSLHLSDQDREKSLLKKIILEEIKIILFYINNDCFFIFRWNVPLNNPSSALFYQIKLFCITHKHSTICHQSSVILTEMTIGVLPWGGIIVREHDVLKPVSHYRPKENKCFAFVWFTIPHCSYSESGSKVWRWGETAWWSTEFEFKTI